MVPFRASGASFRRRAGGVAALWCVLGLLLLGGGAVSSTPLDGGDDTMQPVEGLEMGHARFTSPRFSRAAAEEAGRDDVGGKVLEAGIARVSSSLHRFSDKMRSLTNALAGQVRPCPSASHPHPCRSHAPGLLACKRFCPANLSHAYSFLHALTLWGMTRQVTGWEELGMPCSGPLQSIPRPRWQRSRHNRLPGDEPIGQGWPTPARC